VPATSLDPGAFANLPKPGSARVLDDPVERDSVITQSFLVSGLGPAGVIDYYAQTLPEGGWVSAGVSAKGSTTLRSTWLRGESRLQVTAFSEDGVQSPGPTQLDLQLHLA
jgi:hypothetical protein